MRSSSAEMLSGNVRQQNCTQYLCRHVPVHEFFVAFGFFSFMTIDLNTFEVEQWVVVRVSLQDGAEERRTSSENHLGSQILARENIWEKV